MDVPVDRQALSAALNAAREYTLALYKDLPPEWWNAARFPFHAVVNPPLWELGHIAWFQEFFVLRWSEDDIDGRATPPLLPGADALFNSSRVAHATRWQLTYPAKSAVMDYMAATLSRVTTALQTESAAARVSLAQLALLHEDMHSEALVMTQRFLGLPWPRALTQRLRPVAASGALKYGGGEILLGASTRALPFDNELSPATTRIAAFEIDAAPVRAGEFAKWRGVPCEGDPALPAMGVTRDDAAAYAAAIGRRLPSESEWEAAAVSADLGASFWASTGQVWEWTASDFAPRPGFVPGPYRDYSAPWFLEHGTTHAVLKGGSFATHPRMKYPQYRNFFTPTRTDIFAGFRTCRST
jgi:EgtB-related family protein